MPRQKKHPHHQNSEQDVGTPSTFLDAVEQEFGVPAVDLAAHDQNCCYPEFVGPEQDSLTVDWTALLNGRIGWLNPPYEHMLPWARKCREEAARGAKILLLTPAGISSKWFRIGVTGEPGDRAGAARQVLGLCPKLTFQGWDAVHSKDLMLSVYGFDLPRRFDQWEWTRLRGIKLQHAEKESFKRRWPDRRWHIFTPDERRAMRGDAG